MIIYQEIIKILKKKFGSIPLIPDSIMDDDRVINRLKKIKDFIVIVWIIADIILLTLTYFLDLSSIYVFIVIFDTALCVVLFTEFVYKIYTKENKIQYLKDDWRGVVVDVLAMFPYELISFGSYGFIRLLRLVRIFALFGKGRRTILNFVEKTHLNYVFFTLLIIVVASSIAILVLESTAASEIHTPLDAIWYVVSTITTVGYGDEVPISSGGKVLGIMLMIVGVGFFSILTASLSSYFMRDIETEEEELKDKIISLETTVNEMRSQIEEVKDLLKENMK